MQADVFFFRFAVFFFAVFFFVVFFFAISCTSLRR